MSRSDATTYSCDSCDSWLKPFVDPTTNCTNCTNIISRTDTRGSERVTTDTASSFTFNLCGER